MAFHYLAATKIVFKMKKIVLLLSTLFMCSQVAEAQIPEKRVCGTLLHHEYLKQTRPNYEQELNQYNQIIDQYLASQAANPELKKTNAIITIPVVVHVVYNTTAENISDAQAISQVQVLNDDFARLNTDANKVTQPTFSTIAAGSQIRFCLAQRDPNGNPTTGVIHKSTTATSFGTNDAVKSATSGGDNPWDVTRYVNIWICDLSGSLLGYGEFPTGSLSNTWGLVIDYAYAGKGGSAQAPYNLGRTGTHEFGHCFNLYHIWGDDNGACTGSDQCSDTPNQASEHGGSFTAGSIQTDACSPSSPGTMWMNYMDYTNDNSMYMFTAQQVARMEAIVNNPPWNVLANSNGCTPVSALDASISSIINPSNGIVTCNNTFTPKVQLLNVGSTTMTSAIINYKMDATTTRTLSWSGSLATSASTVLTLNAYTGLSISAHTFSVWVSSPNGSTDQNSTNNSSVSSFSVISTPVGATLPFTERFEATTFPPTGWVKQSLNVLNAANTWTRVTNSTGIPVVPASTACAKMDNYSGGVNTNGQLDALISPPINLTGSNNTLRLKFDVSHRMKITTVGDTLKVYISTDCGGSWTRLYSKGGTQLSTNVGTSAAAYTPTVNTQWRRDSLSLSSYSVQPSVYLKFESRSGDGNNIYLDNINVEYTAAAALPVASFSVASVKCVGNSISLSDQSSSSPTSWAWSFPGGTPSTSTVQNPSVTYTSSGTYTITLRSANATGTSTPVSQVITVNANPSVSVSNSTICSGIATNLSATGAVSYNWNTGATTSSISVTPTITTNYTVTGITNGCSNTKTVSVTVKSSPTVAVSNTTICRGNSATLLASGATTYSWNTGATTASISVTPTTTVSYTVRGTTNGCANTKTVSVTVTANPTVAVSSATVCRGTPKIVTASGATTYSWNTGATTASISVTPTITTSYTVRGTTNGCSNTKTVSVNVNSLPNVTLASITSPLCVGGGTVALSGSPAGGVYSGTGVSGASFNPSVSGAGTFTATYSYTNTNSCSASATRTISVSLCTGITEFDNSTITIYPNPVKDVIYVAIDGSISNQAIIELYDAVGKLVIHEQAESIQTALNVNALSKGIYILRIVSDGKQITKRIIKE